MPFYEYRCDNCEHQMEALQKISDAPLVECPLCGEASLKRLISPVAFRLKGSGWYETDFKKGGKKNLFDAGAKERPGSTETKPTETKDTETKSSGTKSESGGAALTTKPAEEKAAD